MQHLFSVNTKGKVVLDPHALGIAAFRKIWNKHKDKEKAINELSYIYYMCDYKSYFSNITDEDEKHVEICKAVFNKEDYKVDNDMLTALKQYRKDIPISVSILEDAKIGINTLREYFKGVDLMELDPKTGKPVHDPTKFSNNLKSLADNIDNLEKLEDKVKRDTQISSNVRGGREKGIFEDPD